MGASNTFEAQGVLDLLNDNCFREMTHLCCWNYDQSHKLAIIVLKNIVWLKATKLFLIGYVFSLLQRKILGNDILSDLNRQMHILCHFIDALLWLNINVIPNKNFYHSVNMTILRDNVFLLFMKHYRLAIMLL